jgi:hypothetical protein
MKNALFPPKAPPLANSGSSARHTSAQEKENACTVGPTHVVFSFPIFSVKYSHPFPSPWLVSSHEHHISLVLLGQRRRATELPCLSCGRCHHAFFRPHDELSHASPSAASSSASTSSVRTPLPPLLLRPRYKPVVSLLGPQLLRCSQLQAIGGAAARESQCCCEQLAATWRRNSARRRCQAMHWLPRLQRLPAGAAKASHRSFK